MDSIGAVEVSIDLAIRVASRDLMAVPPRLRSASQDLLLVIHRDHDVDLKVLVPEIRTGNIDHPFHAHLIRKTSEAICEDPVVLRSARELLAQAAQSHHPDLDSGQAARGLHALELALSESASVQSRIAKNRHPRVLLDEYFEGNTRGKVAGVDPGSEVLLDAPKSVGVIPSDQVAGPPPIPAPRPASRGKPPKRPSRPERTASCKSGRALAPPRSARSSGNVFAGPEAAARFLPGRALFNPPRTMWVGVAEPVELRLTAKDVLTVEQRLEIEKTMVGRGEIQESAVKRVGARMAAQLFCDKEYLAIECRSSTEQDVDLEGVTIWDWMVRPLRPGTTTLDLRLTLRQDAGGIALVRDLEALRSAIKVKVKTIWTRPRRFWRDQWAKVITLVIAAGGLALGVVTFLQSSAGP